MKKNSRLKDRRTRNNPVAKFNKNRGGVHAPRKGKGKRKAKYKEKYEYLYDERD